MQFVKTNKIRPQRQFDIKKQKQQTQSNLYKRNNKRQSDFKENPPRSRVQNTQFKGVVLVKRAQIRGRPQFGGKRKRTIESCELFFQID